MSPSVQLEDSELILQSVYRHEKEEPNHEFLIQPFDGGQIKTYTWVQVVDEARRMAQHLASFNFPAESKIAILSKNSAEFIISDLAIWMAGHVSVAIYPTSSDKTVQYVLEHSEAKFIFVGKLDTWDIMKPGVPEDMPRVHHTLAPENNHEWQSIIKRTQPIEGRPVRGAKDLAIMIYTSGSTGAPKGVMHDFYNMSIAAKGASITMNMTSKERVISYLPLAHVFERWAVETSGLIVGATIYFAESLDTFVQDVQRAKPTVFISVPRLWVKFQLGVFANMPEKKLNFLMKIPILNGIVRKKILTGLGLENVRMAGSGSAPLPNSVLNWYKDVLGLNLLEGYAMSENFSYSHTSPPDGGTVGYVGLPQLWVEQRINEHGEVEVKGPSSMLGYYKQPELTAESFTEDGFLRTGDRGEINADGFLKITGRTKELFKTSKGKYVAPAPIENLLSVSHSVELCCVSGAGYKSPYALIMIAEEIRPKLSQAEVRNEVATELENLLVSVNAQLEEHEKLAFLVVVSDEWSVENELLTPTLKIKRSGIEGTYNSKLDDWYAQGKTLIWN